MDVAPPSRRRLTFGTWIGGDRDGNPNVTPEVTLEVIRLQHEHAIRDALDLVDELRHDLSLSTRLVRCRRAARSLAADLAALPEIDERYLRLNAEEPYRLKAICIRARSCAAPRPGSARRRRTSPGRDYRDGTDELIADLVLHARLACSPTGASWSPTGRSIGRSGPWPRWGLQLATMDIREHADAHHGPWASCSTGSASPTGATSRRAAPAARCWPRAGRPAPAGAHAARRSTRNRGAPSRCSR